MLLDVQKLKECDRTFALVFGSCQEMENAVFIC